MVLFSFSHGKAEKGMKRESGVSPELSRSCKSRFHCATQATEASASGRRASGGQARKPAVKQKEQPDGPRGYGC